MANDSVPAQGPSSSHGSKSSSTALEKPKHRHHRHGHIGHDLHDAFRLLRSVAADLMRNVFGHPIPPLPHHKPSTLLQAVRRLHVHQYDSRVRATAENGVDGVHATPPAVVKLGLTYMPYVTATYSLEMPERVGNAEVFFGEYHSKALWSPYFFVARDDELKRFVVAIRGTKSLKDALTDLVADTVPFGKPGSGGMAHRGFVMAATNILGKVRPVLHENLDKYKGYKVAVTGHSLGAAVTQLMVKMMLDEGTFGSDLVAVAIAPPPVFAPLSAIDEDWSNALHCFVHADDIVTRVSLHTLKNLLVLCVHIDRFKKTAKELLNVRVDELENDLPVGDESVFGQTSKLMPGSAANCEECQEIQRENDRRTAHAEQHGSHPVCDKLAAVHRKSCRRRDARLAANGSTEFDEAHHSLEGVVVSERNGHDTPADSSASVDVEADQSHQEAENAARAHHRHLLRFKHHHKEDVKKIEQLVVAAENIHWLVDANTHMEGHQKVGEEDGPPSRARRKYGKAVQGVMSSALLRVSKSLQALHVGKKSPTTKDVGVVPSPVSPEPESKPQDVPSEDAEHVDHHATRFVLMTLPPNAFQAVFLTPTCIDSHHLKHYENALAALTTCQACEAHRQS